jgi:transcriptional regulator with XRE-family HTH domain
MSLMLEPSRFGDELRRWRTLRRWSQLELAIRADTTQRHVSFMEQGRSRPGRSMVVRLAESLELSLRERNALLNAAGFAPLFAESPFDDASIQSVRDALGQIVDAHDPYPAVVVRPYGEMVAMNHSFEILIDGVAPHLCEPPMNVLRMALHPDGLASRVVNLPEWARHIIDSLRGHATRSPDPVLDDFIAELLSYVPAPSVGPDHLGFAVPLRLQCADGELCLITTITSFATAIDVTLSELRIEAFLPADAASADILRRSAHGAGPRR